MRSLSSENRFTASERKLHLEKSKRLAAKMGENNRISYIRIYLWCFIYSSLFCLTSLYLYHSYIFTPKLGYLSTKIDLREYLDGEKKDLDHVSKVLSYLLQKSKVHDQLLEKPEQIPEIPVIMPKVVKINVPSAYLRTSPSKESEPLMTMSRGSELVVIEEMEAWTKVHAPTGEVAWVMNEVIG